MKAAFHKFYLVHPWIPWLKYALENHSFWLLILNPFEVNLLYVNMSWYPLVIALENWEHQVKGERLLQQGWTYQLRESISKPHQGFISIEKTISFYESPVIRQKGESQKGCFKKTKHAKFSEKKTKIFSTPVMHTYVCVSGGTKYLRFFSENLLCFVFLKHLIWYSPFCLITDKMFLIQWIFSK